MHSYNYDANDVLIKASRHMQVEKICRGNDAVAAWPMYPASRPPPLPSPSSNFEYDNSDETGIYKLPP